MNLYQLLSVSWFESYQRRTGGINVTSLEVHNFLEVSFQKILEFYYNLKRALVWLLIVSGVEALFLETWGVWSSLLSLLPDPLWPGEIVTIRLSSIGQIDQV